MKMDHDSFQLRVEIGEKSNEGNKNVSHNSLEKAVDCFQKAYQKARQLNDDQTERICAFNLGAAYIAGGEPLKGLEYLHKAKPPDNQTDGRSNGDLYFNMAFGYEKTEDLKKAFEHYKIAHDEFKDNIDMQTQCLEKCLQIQQKWKKFSSAAEICQSMAELYRRKENVVKQAECLYEMASQLRLAGENEKVSSAAKECRNVLASLSPEGQQCEAAAKVLNDLGLVYTQIQSYNEASQCFEKALEWVHQGNTVLEHKQLEAVVMQNLGAAYNFLGDYQRSIKFHEDAADKYAKLNYRNGQGQCFINLAFALSQLGQLEIRNAELAFHHALLASKDTSDKHMKWQALEGLGAVNFNMGEFDLSKRFFQDALKYVGENAAVAQRIVDKLTHVIAYKSGRAVQYSVLPNRETMMYNPAQPHMTSSVGHKVINEAPVIPQQVQNYQSAPQRQVPIAGAQPMMQSFRENEDEPKAIRGKIPMRRKDSESPHFPKIARGLSSGTITPTYGSLGQSPRFKVMSQQQLGLNPISSSEPESGLDESSESESLTSNSDGGEEEAENTEEIKEEKINQIFSRPSTASRQVQLSPTPQTGLSEIEEYQRRLQEKEAQEKEEETDKGDSSESESDEESGEDTSDDEDYTDEDQTQVIRAASPPPVPAQSPPRTGDVNTKDLATNIQPQHKNDKQYNSSHRVSSPMNCPEASGISENEESTEEEEEEEEEDEETNPYATIDTMKRSQRVQDEEGNNDPPCVSESSVERKPQGKVRDGNRQNSSNFFDSEDSLSERSELNEREANRQHEHKSNDDETGQVTEASSSNQRDSLEEEDKKTDLDKLPRGQREQILHDEHQKRLQEHSTEPPPQPPQQQEKSKTCAIM